MIISSSFRDPSGFVFQNNGIVYRQINKIYENDYLRLMSSGLYQELVSENLLIHHEEASSVEPPVEEKCYKIIQPLKIEFISYPYEWSFHQLKDAALLTLNIQKKALQYNMTLKDASGYNVQFHNGKPIFIDTLSFETYNEGDPWVAYRQFIQHFFAPLVLMNEVDIRLNDLLKNYIDGLPLDLASAILPKKTYFNFTVLTHIHLHAKSQKHYGSTNKKIINQQKVSKHSLLALLDNLESYLKKLECKSVETEWGNYYSNTNYSDEAAKFKGKVIEGFLEEISPEFLWDLGANTGHYSRIASSKGVRTISFDIDPIAVSKNYLQVKDNKESNILPLLLDLTNPSPNIGWANNERLSIINRGLPDTVMALALIHHLVISANIPLSKIATFFNNICDSLIIEFVPKTDSQVEKMLTNRKDIFEDYTQNSFEKEFRSFFTMKEAIKIPDSERTIYLFQKERKEF
ncbi:hypothetical protein ACFQI7_24480 [Paenibacillus allorhizosphaerae]|uniref:hypothetical protein n=2 Tax=Paenibacillus allorhizosphaerae TaxID=2849866 RepID=UPI0036232296